jgi:hypothetical protein
MTKRKKSRNLKGVSLSPTQQLSEVYWHCERCGKPANRFDAIFLHIPYGLCFECHADDQLGPEAERDARWGLDGLDDEFPPQPKRTDCLRRVK